MSDTVLAREGAATAIRLELHGDEIPRASDFVQTDATNAGDLSVDPRMVVPEETDTRSNTSEQDREPRRFADVARATPMLLEPHTRRRIVREHDVQCAQIT
jgi:hypothetical protein